MQRYFKVTFYLDALRALSFFLKANTHITARLCPFSKNYNRGCNLGLMY